RRGRAAAREGLGGVRRHEPQAPFPQSARGADDVRMGHDAGRARPLFRRDRAAAPARRTGAGTVSAAGQRGGDRGAHRVRLGGPELQSESLKSKDIKIMEMRPFGRTGMNFSILGFGCGAVGGLMVRGDPADQERTVARALDAGVNYFDTAVQYGDGASEKNPGPGLKALKPGNVFVGTKVRLKPEEFGRIGAAVTASLENSLQRLGLERVDIFHLHNSIDDGAPAALSAAQVLDEVVPAFDKLRRDGKLRFPGLTAIGDTAPPHGVIDTGALSSAQVTYNMLNPSAVAPMQANDP